MRKASLLLLFITLCTSLIIPVFALTFNVDFSGDIEWDGVASGRDSNRYLEVKVYSKKPLPKEIWFSENWPSILTDYSTDEIELYIRINKKNDNVKLNFAWGEFKKNPSINRYVCSATGKASLVEGEWVITIKEVEILERVKPNDFEVVHPRSSVTLEYTISGI